MKIERSQSVLSIVHDKRNAFSFHLVYQNRKEELQMSIKKLKRNIKLDYINTFIACLNMQSSVWILYLAHCGMNLMQIGLLEGIYHATSIICEIPSGAMADLIGRKKNMILSRICIAISCVIMLFSKSFYLFALSFIIQALGNNFNSGSEEALVYDSMKCLSEEKSYLRVNGRLNMITEVSQAIATVAGGVLAEYSYFWCYSACVLIAVLALIPVIFMIEPPISNRESNKETYSILRTVNHHFKICIRILIENKRILQIVTYYSVIFATYTLLFFYSQQYYSDMGFNKIQISIILLLIGVVSCLGAFMSEKLYFKFGDHIAVIAAIVIAITLVCYGFTKQIISILTFIVASFFNSVLYPVESNALNSLIPSEQRATLISVNSMFFSIMMIIMFPIVGAFADQWGLGCIFNILGILLLILIGIWNFIKKNDVITE